MNKYLFLLLVSFSAFTQTNNISVVSAEKLNVVYRGRGVNNPIKIAVPGAKSFTATAPYLVAVDSLGNYKLSVGQGKEVKILIEGVMENGNILQEQKIFRIKSLPTPLGTINGDNCSKCIVELTKKELFENEIEVSFRDFLFDVQQSLYVRNFTVVFPDGMQLLVEGSVLDQKSKNKIALLKKGDIIIISQIIYYEDFEGVDMVPAVPIKIMFLD